MEAVDSTGFVVDAAFDSVEAGVGLLDFPVYFLGQPLKSFESFEFFYDLSVAFLVSDDKSIPVLLDRLDVEFGFDVDLANTFEVLLKVTE